MDINQQKEQFSRAYVHAVATVTGFALYEPAVDDDSVDCGVAQTGGNGTVRSPRLELQIKCTETGVLRADGVHFQLKRKNYDDLRNDDVLVPRILVVVLVPALTDDWLKQTPDELSMRKCGYWASLRGRPDVAGVDRPTVVLPAGQLFTVEQLRGMMNRIGNRELP